MTTQTSLVIKRCLDLMLALIALLILSPLLAVVAVAILLTDGRPVLFRQARLGRDGHTFLMIKFRSMQLNAPDLRLADGSTYSAYDDPRLTHIGRRLRQYSIDELPQLVNVVRGDMSLVGPRPELPDQAQYYTHTDKERLCMRPGMTGLAQVRGRNAITWQARRRWDRWYVRHWSLTLDILIMLSTIPRILKRAGIVVTEQQADL